MIYHCLYLATCAESDAPGLSNDDLQASIASLESMAQSLNAECIELRRHQEEGGTVAEFLVRVRAEEKDFTEVRSATSALFASAMALLCNPW